ncbi:MAG TPA: hypothetical protein VFN26_22780 [Candidatus Acidoferrum sp.]|nr:hypothetical protein [Candidatus Acidoferrum sp.]
MSKTLQNVSFLSQGPHAASDPCVSVYHHQQHFGYRDQDGIIWDAWYNGSGHWNLQRINGGGDGRTSGPTAVAGPFIGVFKDQQHFAYLDEAGIIWDAWYDGSGHWNLQRINGGAFGGPAALYLPNHPSPFVSIWNDPSNTQQHFTYLDIDHRIYDVFWDSDPPLRDPFWNRQLIQGPNASSSPFACVFHEQQHIGYLFEGGNIQDTWYDGNGHWNEQVITGGFGGDSRTSGPEAFWGMHPFIWVDHTNTQQHFTYLGHDRAIYDAFWDSNSGSWNLQKLTSGGLTDGPAAWSSPTVCNYEPTGIINVVYIAYRDEIGTVWTVAYANETWFAVQLKDLPFSSSTDPTDNVPRAAGNVIAWVDVSGNQIHFTFRGTENLRPPVPVPPVPVEARVVTATPPLATTTLGDSAPANLAGQNGVIWDFFYEPEPYRG